MRAPTVSPRNNVPEVIFPAGLEASGCEKALRSDRAAAISGLARAESHRISNDCWARRPASEGPALIPAERLPGPESIEPSPTPAAAIATPASLLRFRNFRREITRSSTLRVQLTHCTPSRAPRILVSAIPHRIEPAFTKFYRSKQSRQSRISVVADFTSVSF